MKKLNKILLSFAIVLMLGVSFLLVGCGNTKCEIQLSHVGSSNRGGGTLYGSGIYNKGDTVKISAVPDEGSYLECWTSRYFDDDIYFDKEIEITATKDYQQVFALFYKGQCIEYNGYRIIAKDGIIEEEGDYFYISPNDDAAFGYWYDLGDSNYRDREKSDETNVYSDWLGIVLRKSSIKSNHYFVPYDSMAGVAYFTTEDCDAFVENLDMCTTLEQVIQFTSYVDYGYVQFNGSNHYGVGYTYGNTYAEGNYTARDININLEKSNAFIPLYFYRVGSEMKLKRVIPTINNGLDVWEEGKLRSGNYVYHYKINIY